MYSTSDPSQICLHMQSDTFRLAIWQSWTKIDTFRSAIWKVCKKLIGSDRRSEYIIIVIHFLELTWLNFTSLHWTENIIDK